MAPKQSLDNEQIDARFNELALSKCESNNHYVPMHGEKYITVGGCKYPEKDGVIDWDLYNERMKK